MWTIEAQVLLYSFLVVQSSCKYVLSLPTRKGCFQEGKSESQCCEMPALFKMISGGRDIGWV